MKDYFGKYLTPTKIKQNLRLPVFLPNIPLDQNEKNLVGMRNLSGIFLGIPSMNAMAFSDTRKSLRPASLEISDNSLILYIPAYEYSVAEPVFLCIPKNSVTEIIMSGEKEIGSLFKKKKYAFISVKTKKEEDFLFLIQPERIKYLKQWLKIGGITVDISIP